MVNSRQRVLGVILAGGQSSRYGTDKAFVSLAGRNLIDHVIARIMPQVDELLISAGDDPRFAALGLPIVTDTAHDGEGQPAGPLAGVLAALDWMAEHVPDAGWLATSTIDTPFLPVDLVARLRAAVEGPLAGQGAVMACSRSGGRLHPLHALWSPSLRLELRDALQRGERAVTGFAERNGAVSVDFSIEPFDPLANVNTPADLDSLARQMAIRPGA